MYPLVIDEENKWSSLVKSKYTTYQGPAGMQNGFANAKPGPAGPQSRESRTASSG